MKLARNPGIDNNKESFWECVRGIVLKQKPKFRKNPVAPFWKKGDENGPKTVLRFYLANRKSHVKNSKTKNVVRLFIHDKGSIHFSRKCIIFDAILSLSFYVFRYSGTLNIRTVAYHLTTASMVCSYRLLDTQIPNMTSKIPYLSFWQPSLKMETAKLYRFLTIRL